MTGFHTFSGIWRICDNYVVLPRNPEDLAVSDGVDVRKLSQLLEIWAHQDFYLTHVRLLDLQDTNTKGVKSYLNAKVTNQILYFYPSLLKLFI